MNMQKQPPQKIVSILKQRNVSFYDIEYYAWPQSFGSTAGPCGGLGGQTICSFTVEAWVCNHKGPTVFVCAGMYSFIDERFEPLKLVNYHWIRM